MAMHTPLRPFFALSVSGEESAHLSIRQKIGDDQEALLLVFLNLFVAEFRKGGCHVSLHLYYLRITIINGRESILKYEDPQWLKSGYFVLFDRRQPTLNRSAWNANIRCMADKFSGAIPVRS